MNTKVNFKHGEAFGIMQEIRLAKDKEKQVTITAELHAIERWKLRMWLIQEGQLPYNMQDVKKAVEYYRGLNGRKKLSPGNIRNFIGAFATYHANEIIDVIQDAEKMNAEEKRLEETNAGEDAGLAESLAPVKDVSKQQKLEQELPIRFPKEPEPQTMAPEKWPAVADVAKNVLEQMKLDFKDKHDCVQALEQEMKDLRMKIDEIETFLELYGR